MSKTKFDPEKQLSVRRSHPELADFEDALRQDERLELMPSTGNAYFRVYIRGKTASGYGFLRTRIPPSPSFIEWPKDDPATTAKLRQAFDPICIPCPPGRIAGLLIRDEITWDRVLAAVLEYADLACAEFAAPEEVTEDRVYQEGATRRVLVNAFERNTGARAACIDAYGAKCRICGLDFASTYGKEFAGFIHVHHLRPLSDVREDYVVDPLRDLCPVCPNCHAVLHYGGKLRDPDAVRQLLAKAKEA